MEEEKTTQKKPLIQESNDQLNPALIKLLSQANQYISQYQKFFNLQDGAQIIKIINYFKNIEKQQTSYSHFCLESKNLEELTPDEILIYLTNLNVSEEQKNVILCGWFTARSLEIYKIRMQGLSFSEKKFSPLKKKHQLQAIFDEINEFEYSQKEDGQNSLQVINDWDSYYRLAQKIINAKNEDDLRNIANFIELHIQNEKIKKRLQKIIEEKLNPPLEEKDIEEIKETYKEIYKKVLEEVLNYLRYINPEENSFTLSILEKIFKAVTEQTLKILASMREIDFTPFIPANKLTMLFWAIRLNRPIPEILYDKIPPFIKKLIKKMEEKYFDDYLSTEAAGFWLEKNLIFPDMKIYTQELSPQNLFNQLILKLIDALLKTLSEKDKQKGELFVNLIINDQKIYQIKINPQEKENNLANQILNQLENPQEIKEEDIYSLKQDAYTTPRNKQKRFHQKEGSALFSLNEKMKENSFCIRINDQPEKRQKNHPQSLFMVNGHQAQINFDIYNNYVNFAIKFAHKHFDGIPAKNFFMRFLSSLKNNFNIEDYHGENTDQTINTTIPLFESQATKKYDEILADFMFLNEKLKNFNPSFVYALSLAIANNIDNFHFLVDGPNIFKESEYYTNVQPIVCSLKPIKRIIEKIKRKREKIKNNQHITEEDELNTEDKLVIQRWMKSTMEEYQRGKKGLATTATLAGIAGELEKPLSQISKNLHKGILALIHAQGMVSVLVSLKPQEKNEGITFFTAQSDVYQIPINVAHPQPSMGVIGINQNQTIYGETEIIITTRKTISQAQIEIKRWIDEKISPGLKRDMSYKIINKILNNWQKLNTGQIDLNEYERTFKNLFKQLPQELKDFFGNEEKKLQENLNQLLQKSARATFENDIQECIQIIKEMLEFATTD